MKKHLTFKDNKSDKFWNIETSGTSYTVTYGKTGTAGQTSTKEFDTEEKCMKEAEKLVSEKVKKGYGENGAESSLDSQQDKYYCSTCGVYAVNKIPGCICGSNLVLDKKKASPHGSYIQEWEEIINAKDLHKALIKHFSYLADMPGFEPVLNEVMKQIDTAEIEKGNLVLKFKNSSETMIASPPAKLVDYKKYPASFQKLVENHEQLYLIKAWIYIGNSGFDGTMLEDSDTGTEWLSMVKKPEEILVALTDYSDWWLFHPKKKSAGTPILHFCSHEDCSINEEGEPYAIGSFFLKKLVETLEHNIAIPQESPSKKTVKTSNDDDYWKYLESAWNKNQKALYDRDENGALKNALSNEVLKKIDEVTFRGINTIAQVPFKSMPTLRVLNLYASDKKKDPKLKSLKGIEGACYLKELRAEQHDISSIEELATLSKLEELDLRFNQLQDISLLKKCKELRSVLLYGNKISDLSVFNELHKIERIWLQKNPIKDILPLAKLKNLKELGIPTNFPKANLEQFKKLRPDVEIDY